MKQMIRILLILASICMLVANIEAESIFGTAASALFLSANSLAFGYNLLKPH